MTPQTPTFQIVHPATRLSGAVNLPGDRHISYRLAAIAALADGLSKITNFSVATECQAMLDRIRSQGVDVSVDGITATIQGKGLDNWSLPAQDLAESLAQRSIRGGNPTDTKTSAILAALFTDGPTTILEPSMLPDHTEIALRHLGADIRSMRRVITVQGRPHLEGREMVVPGDLPLAAYFLVAGLLVPGSHLVIQNVGLSPVRSLLLDFLLSIGANIRVARIESVNGEMIGDLEVRHSRIQGGELDAESAAELTEELPVLCVLGAASEQGLVIRSAQESPLPDTLTRIGLGFEFANGNLRVPGRQTFRAGAFDAEGDPWIAMALAIAALRADGPSTITDAGAVSNVFPEFWNTLARISHT